MKCEDVASVLLTIQQFGVECGLLEIGDHLVIGRAERYALGSQSLFLSNKHYQGKPVNPDKWRRLFQIHHEIVN